MTPTAQALWQGWVPKIGGRKTRRKHRPVGDWPALPDGLHAQLGTGRRAVGCWPAPRAGYPEDSGGVPSPRKRSPVDAFGSWAAPTPPRWQGGHPLVLAHVDAPSGQEQSWGTGGTGEWKVGTMRHCSAGRAVWERWPRAVGPSWSPSLAWRPRPYFFLCLWRRRGRLRADGAVGWLSAPLVTSPAEDGGRASSLGTGPSAVPLALWLSPNSPRWWLVPEIIQSYSVCKVTW